VEAVGKRGVIMRHRTISTVLGAALIASLPSCARESAAKGQVRLNGAGSTFAYPLYTQWASAFGKVRPDVAIDYESIGSSGGINLVSDGRMDFGATDGPMTDAQLDAFTRQRNSKAIHVPTALGADVAAYNLPGINVELKFTPQVLAGIFLGSISKWNDPMLAAANPGVALPNVGIEVVHRSDGSGTTYVWTDYLSKVSEEWRTKVGRGTSVTWPTGTGASGNQAVADMLRVTPNSIGYVELIYAIRAKLEVGRIQNAAGEFVKADLKTITAAAAASADSLPEDFRASITNAPGGDAYPVASFTWILVPSTIGDSAKRDAMIAFLRWALTDGQGFTEKLSYARLPDSVIAKARVAVERIQ